MREAKCSLLLQDEISYDAKIKALPKQRVLVYQDKGFNPAATSNGAVNGGDLNSSANNGEENSNNNHFYVDFKGATILQLEPGYKSNTPHKTMPVTLTVAGRCVFTPENYQDFRVMMRTRQQSKEMDIAPNGNFDWPDVNSLLLCPVCGEMGPIPREGDRRDHEYWMVFYPLLQITVCKGTQMTLGTRTICRLTCLECMEDLLEGMMLTIQPGGGSSTARTTSGTSSTNAAGGPAPRRRTRLAFTLPAADVLAEAGSASFLEDGPPRPDTHPHIDDILDAWTLYNLWEHSGAWEALQNDYRIVLSRSMHAGSGSGGGAGDTNETAAAASSGAGDDLEHEPRLKERMGKSCGNPQCSKVHGRTDDQGEMIRLAIKCRECHSEFYCSKACREAAVASHREQCAKKQRDREERREKKAKRVECDTCHNKFPVTKMKKCSRCRNATYCSVECQRADWERHKTTCQRKS